MPVWNYRRSAVALSLFIAAAACAGTSTSEQVTRPADGRYIEMSREKTYTSLDQLTADSDAVARVKTTSKTAVVEVDNIPFTITDVRVTEVLRGSLPDSIRIRQTGTSDTRYQDSGSSETTRSPVLHSSTTYLLFLDRFNRPGEDVTNQYVIVGVAAGIFREEGDQALLQDNESPNLPATVSIPSLRSRIAG
ncbi:hypothetical protein [Frankia sp. Cppng1_Ct_nod]|uniref:hypothetical protein n=1 Tax=Frankia sp. Cppng1_Ct_nod TaxID=2897162 RepID=UPI0010419C85|nr:hypothetical protein [Frankia sp. Cppng1_Ct_nod]